LGCCLQNPALILSICKFLRGEVFYDLRHQILWETMKLMAAKSIVIDVLSVQTELKRVKRLEEVGGLKYVTDLADSVPSPANVQYYLDIVLEKHALRETKAVCLQTARRIEDYEGAAEDLMAGIRAEIETVTNLHAPQLEPEIKIWRASELLKYEVPEHLTLIGDNEITMGYEALTLIAGQGGAGKSMASMSLALAGAIGEGTWQGRKVHRQFKTMYIQAEDPNRRLKKAISNMVEAYPGVDIEGHVFFSEAPRGGLSFHRSEFRTAVRKVVDQFKPDLVILDAWQDIAVEDSAKEVVDKLVEIRACFPSGDNCPGLLIVAHTKKPRSEDVKRGRALTNQISGSVALPNTARCVYVMLPWNEDPEEKRIYWICSKLNTGEMYAPSVWKRRLGMLFEHDPDTDPRAWGHSEAEEVAAEGRRVLKPEILKEAFGDRMGMKRAELYEAVRKLAECKRMKIGNSTIWRAISKEGYLSDYLSEAAGMIGLNKEAFERNGK
jgi:hypothetical protein